MSIARSRYLFFVEKAVALLLLAFAVLITCQTDDLFSDHACIYGVMVSFANPINPDLK